MKRALLLVLLAVGVAEAQPAEVSAQIKLIEQQPADLDRAAWKEKRRDAARRLAQSKDKRAVPTLIKLVETETFDIIGEIAIEGLGNLGDPSAVPVLQKVANDAGRDKVQRDLAKKALGKLRAPATPPPVTPPTPDPAPAPTPVPTEPAPAPSEPAPATPPDDASGAASGSVLLGERPTATLPALPVIADDALAAYDRRTLSAGTAHLGYDTVRKRTAFDADLAARWARRVERPQSAFGWDAEAHVVAGYINPEGRAQTRGVHVNVNGRGEARFYSGSLYGIGKLALGTEVDYIADLETDANNDNKDVRYTADLQLALGGGYGRVLDVGGAIRVRRLARVLDAARALGKPIDAATARRLQLTWWSLRGERSTYPALVATVAILREAGVLLSEPDAGLSYELLTVLRDNQLFQRPSGLDVQLVFGEGYLLRPDEPRPAQSGRVEQLLASAGYGAQLGDDTLELSGQAFGRLRLFAPDAGGEEQPAPWAVGVTGRMRKFTYGEHGDPFGALDVAGTVLASKGDRLFVGEDDSGDELGLRLEGELGWTHWLNQASGLRLAASLAVDGGELFFGASLEATYGLLDATFSQ